MKAAFGETETMKSFTGDGGNSKDTVWTAQMGWSCCKRMEPTDPEATQTNTEMETRSGQSCSAPDDDDNMQSLYTHMHTIVILHIQCIRHNKCTITFSYFQPFSQLPSSYYSTRLNRRCLHNPMSSSILYHFTSLLFRWLKYLLLFILFF